MRQLSWLLRLEALICALAGLAALLLPELPIRFLSQAPVGSLVGWLDVVHLVRAAGWMLELLAVLHLLAPLAADRCLGPTRVMTAVRVAAGIARWWLVVDASPAIAWLGWLDLGLAAWSILALLGTGSVDREPPDTRAMVGTAARTGRPVLRLVGGLLAIGVALAMADRLFRTNRTAGPPTESKAGALPDAEHFKHASLMRPGLPGFPLYIFEALPQTFPDRLPGGWASLGLIFEPGRTTPVGFAEHPGPIPGLTPNCALCHSATYRTSESSPPRFVPGAPSGSLDFQRLMAFLFEAAADPRFTDGTLMAAMRARRGLSGLEGAVYERVVIPAAAGVLRMARRDFDWMVRAPVAGPGRQDAGTVLKHNILRLPLDGTVANSDYRPVWSQRDGYRLLHRWSGGGQLLAQENLLAAALFNAMEPALLDRESFARITNYLAQLAPPAFPLPISRPLADRGAGLFRQHCAECHDPGGARYNAITPLREIGTDGEYLAASTPEFLTSLSRFERGPFRFNAQQATDGYLNSSLEGLWLRAPYLHNGSVPTVADLLEPPERRPSTFRRGGDVVDGERLGLRTGRENADGGFLFDTRARGNANSGHRYGVDLPHADKQALLEHLKTL